MKYLIALFISSLVFVSCAQEQVQVDPLIDTNLVDNLKTRIRYRKSRNLNLDSLSRMSRLTDMRVRRPRTLKTLDMSVPEMIEAPKFVIEGQDFYFHNKSFVSPLTTKNLFIDELMSRFGVTLIAQNTVNNISTTSISVNDLNTASSIALLSNCSLADLFNSTYSINKLSSNVIMIDNMIMPNIQIANLTYNTLDLFDMSVFNSYGKDVHQIDQSVYVVDQSQFTVEITEEILRELMNDTRLYDFEKSQPHPIAYMKDFSLLSHDDKLKWLDVLQNHKTCNIEFIKSTKTPKIIGEARIENNEYYYQTETLVKNLKYLKSRGYDSVLVRFYVGQNLDFVIQMINDIKSMNMDIYVVYTGLDNRKPVAWNPFTDPEELEKYIAAIAPYATGWLLNWRCTSQHVKLLPKEFFNYLCNIVRKYNDSCMIYGEIYYGQIDPLRTLALMHNIPENVSGVLINNMGFYGYNHQFIVNRLFAKAVPNYSKLSKLAQVVGYRPYYASRHNLYLSVEEEYEYKHKIENNFKRVRCGTVTFIHDGVDDNYAEDIANYQSQDNILYDEKLHYLIKEN